MTREEAINEIKSWDFLEGKEIEAIHTLIPELKESEDERIRKEMVEKITNLACGCFISQEQKQKFIAYLEKQKPSFRQIHDSVMWDSGLRTGIELEKQKEQKPKNILTDDDSLQTAYLKGQTDVLEDPEAYGLQKEQKPNIELIQRSWYMEGYHNREFGKEPKWIIKTGEGGPKHELNPRYGQPLAEQRPTEEQLHNLNEAIKGLRMDGCERIADSLHSLYNILKTQEQKSAWSEEDEKMLKSITGDLFCGTDFNMELKFAASKKVNWLKDKLESLRQNKRD